MKYWMARRTKNPMAMDSPVSPNSPDRTLATKAATPAPTSPR